MSEHPNVALVREGFRRVAERDVKGMIELCDEHVVWFAFDTSGQPAKYDGREEALELVRSGEQLLAQHSYDLVDVRAVGAELVIVQARLLITPAKGVDPIETDYVAVYRVKGNKIISCADFIDSTTEDVLDRAWS